MVQHRTVKKRRQKPPLKTGMSRYFFLLFLAKLHKFESSKTNLLFSNNVDLFFALDTLFSIKNMSQLYKNKVSGENIFLE